MHGISPLVRHDFAAIFGGLDPVWAGRLILTLVLSGIVGLERSTHERASGLRTHILVGLGACLITMAGAYGFADLHMPGGASHNPFILATYVVSGIGFLGAGAILRHGMTVRGLTTAASVWNVAGIGIAAGSGMGTLAIVTVGLILFVLVPLQKWEARLQIGAIPSDLVIHLRDEGKAVGRTLALLNSMGISVRKATVVPGAGTSVLLRIELGIALNQQKIPGVVKRLLDSADVERVDTSVLARTGPAAPNEKVGVRKAVVRPRPEALPDPTRRKVKKSVVPVALDVLPAAPGVVIEPDPATAHSGSADDAGDPGRPNRNRPRV